MALLIDSPQDSPRVFVSRVSRRFVPLCLNPAFLDEPHFHHNWRPVFPRSNHGSAYGVHPVGKANGTTEQGCPCYPQLCLPTSASVAEVCDGLQSADHDVLTGQQTDVVLGSRVHFANAVIQMSRVASDFLGSPILS